MTDLFDLTSEAHGLSDPDAPLMLEHGREYVSIGPAPGGKWPAQRVRVVGVTEKGYVTEGVRQVAPIIVFGCEHMWRPA